MKKYLVLVLVFVLALAALSAGGRRDDAQGAGGAFGHLPPVTLTFGNGAATGAIGDLWGLYFVEAIERITEGRMRINYFGNSQLGVDSELQRQMLAGDIDIVACQPAQTVAFVPEVAVFDLPLLFARYDARAIDRALNDSAFTRLINEAYARRGMVCLGFLQGATFREVTSNRAIRAVRDFSGLRIRTMDSRFHVMFWRALGANPTPLPFTELYMSLQTGVVEAQENALDTNVSAQFFEVQRYLVNTHHILYINQFLMNRVRFENLTPEYQQALRQAVAEATARLAPDMQRINDEMKATMIRRGMTSIDLPPAVFEEMLRRSEDVYRTIRSEIGNQIVDALVNELQAASR